MNKLIITLLVFLTGCSAGQTILDPTYSSTPSEWDKKTIAEVTTEPTFFSGWLFWYLLLLIVVIAVTIKVWKGTSTPSKSSNP